MQNILLTKICLLTVTTEVLSTKKFPTATKPPPPPPAPPLVVFDKPTSQSEAPPQARLEYFELIAPNQNSQTGNNYNPNLSIKNPDFNVVYQTRRPVYRPQFQRPVSTPPLYQFPQQLQVYHRPRSDVPNPGHRFGPQAFNQQQG